MNAGRWVATDRGAFDPAETPEAVSFAAESQPAAFSIGELMSDAQLVLWYEFRGTLPVFGRHGV